LLQAVIESAQWTYDEPVASLHVHFPAVAGIAQETINAPTAMKNLKWIRFMYFFLGYAEIILPPIPQVKFSARRVGVAFAFQRSNQPPQKAPLLSKLLGIGVAKDAGSILNSISS